MPYTVPDKIAASRAECDAAIAAINDEVLVLADFTQHGEHDGGEMRRLMAQSRFANLEVVIANAPRNLTGDERTVQTARFLIQMCLDVHYESEQDAERILAFLRSASELLLMELNRRLVLDKSLERL